MNGGTICHDETTDINAILRSIKETDPDEEIPSGRDVISGLSLEKELSRLVVDHIIGLMDDISTAHSYISTAAA